MKERTSKLIKIGTRVELNDGVALAAQGQKGGVSGHRWSSIDQVVLNVVEMDDPSWGVKFSSGYPREINTLAVGTHCCDLIDGATEEANLFDGWPLRERLQNEYNKAHA